MIVSWTMSIVETVREWTPEEKEVEATASSMLENYNQFVAGDRPTFEVHFPIVEAIGAPAEYGDRYEQQFFALMKLLEVKPIPDEDPQKVVETRDGTRLEFGFLFNQVTETPIQFVVTAQKPMGSE